MARATDRLWQETQRAFAHVRARWLALWQLFPRRGIVWHHTRSTRAGMDLEAVHVALLVAATALDRWEAWSVLERRDTAALGVLPAWRCRSCRAIFTLWASLYTHNCDLVVDADG